MARRFRWSAILTVPLILLAMGEMFARSLSSQAANWLQFLLSTPVVLWAGFPFFERGYRSLANRNLNMFTLISLGTGVSYAYSVLAR